MKKLPLCDCGREGIKKITNGYVCKRCHDIERSLYKDSKNGGLFKYLNLHDKRGHVEIGKFSLS